uniref:Uncharacterized protein n=1 Tax=Anguilla anguilla TaxID=7936 RepID=A0A0E9RAZ9_ANGAN
MYLHINTGFVAYKF